MRKFYPVIVLLLGISLSGCFNDGSDPNSPPRNTSSTGIGDILGDDFDLNTDFRANFDPLLGITPYPNDILGFLANGSTDGTLNLSDVLFQLAASSSFGAPLNDIDGFSVFSRIQANFSEPVSAASLNPLSVFLLEVALDPATRAVIGLSDETLCKLGLAPQPACPAEIFGTGNPFLIQGVDYDLSLAPDIDAGGETIQLVPLKALNTLTVQQFTPGALNGYLMILTDGITNSGGTAAVPDTTYNQIKQGYQAGIIQLPPPGTPLPPDITTEELLALFIAAHLAVVDALNGAGAPVSVDDVVVTASFSPQDGKTVLQTVTNLDVLNNRPSQIAQAILPVDVPLPGGGVLPAGTPVTTGLLRTAGGFPPEASKDNGNIYMGGISIPYFQETPTAESGGYNVLASKWVAEAGKNVLGDPDSTVICRWNPLAIQRADVTIPLIMAIPNDNSAWVQAAQAQGFPVPLPTGWPVVIYQPGFTRNRSDIVLTAEPWLDQGYAVITIDLPYHGITDTEGLLALLRVPGTTERTFDLDLRNNENIADLTPDGLIDESSQNFLNPSPDGLLTTRDNLREAPVSMLSLTRSVGVMDIDANPGNTDFDTSQIHFVGHSGGAIVGASLASLGVEDYVTISLATSGAGIVKLLEDSDSEEGFGFILDSLKAGLLQQGILPNSTTYNNYLRDMQNIWNAGDPICCLKTGRLNPTPIYGNLVNTDVAVVPSASLRVYEAFGMPQITTPGVNLASRGYTRILDGIHGSFISPTPVIEATIEMQTEVAVFLGGNALAGIPPNGQVILISDTSIVETD
ncbi:MAG: hypothetical protein ACR2QU_04825 [Gammaproteobacteria bacterium]